MLEHNKNVFSPLKLWKHFNVVSDVVGGFLIKKHEGNALPIQTCCVRDASLEIWKQRKICSPGLCSWVLGAKRHQLSENWFLVDFFFKGRL